MPDAPTCASRGIRPASHKTRLAPGVAPQRRDKAAKRLEIRDPVARGGDKIRKRERHAGGIGGDVARLEDRRGPGKRQACRQSVRARFAGRAGIGGCGICGETDKPSRCAALLDPSPVGGAREDCCRHKLDIREQGFTGQHRDPSREVAAVCRLTKQDVAWRQRGEGFGEPCRPAVRRVGGGLVWKSSDPVSSDAAKVLATRIDEGDHRARAPSQNSGGAKQLAIVDA